MSGLRGIVWGVRMAAVVLIVGASARAAAPLAPAAVTSLDPDLADFRLVYELALPSVANFNATGVTYDQDHSALVATGSFSRVSYFLELGGSAAAGSPNGWVSVTFDAAGFTTSAGMIGIPTGAIFQQAVSNMTVDSNVPGIVTGSGIQTGNIEFWATNYTAANGAAVPHASDSAFDFGDTRSTTGGYGTMQIHNHDIDGAGPGAVGQTLLAYNKWGNGGATGTASDLGIGTNTTAGPNGQTQPDWTFRNNAGDYSTRRLYVMVDEIAPPEPLVIMPLGDSITKGSTIPGGYRKNLYNDLVATLPQHTIDFVGSQTTNPSASLADSDHEGHGGYRIDELDANLTDDSSRSDDDGGYWLGGGPGDRPDVFPDYILLQAGTNDISQGATPETAIARLQNLIDRIVTERPGTQLIVASVTPRSDGLEATSQAFNALIPGLVADFAALGKHVHFVDMHAVLTTDDLIDSVHPDQGGYDKMAVAWRQAIASVMAIPEPATLLLVAGGMAAMARRR